MIWLTWRQFRAQTVVAAAALAAFAVILGLTGPNLSHMYAASGQAGCRAFQAYETAIFLALALALAGFCVWWIRRRRLA